MATQVFMLNTAADAHLGTNTNDLTGGGTGWKALGTGSAQGAALATASRNTVNGATAGLTMLTGGIPIEFITPPVDADVTISGSITFNLWAHENNMSANAAINCAVYKVAAATGTQTLIHKTVRTTELGFSGAATVQNFAETPAAGVALNKGDRLRLVPFIDDAGTMATGFAATFNWNDTVANLGQSFVTFNETFGFITSDPAGTTLGLSNTASDVNIGSSVDEFKATLDGSGSGKQCGFNANTPAGWTAPQQYKDLSSGNTVEWYTPQLQAFTLGGKAKAQIFVAESIATTNASFAVEIAVCNSDGSGATVWGIACSEAITTSGSVGEVPTTAALRNSYVSGDDVSVTAGQRLRVRVYVDDCGDTPIVTGGTATMETGTLSTVLLPQSVLELATVPRHGFVNFQDPGVL